MSIDKIKGLQARMDDTVKFKKGDVVEWKEGLKNRRVPAYGETVLVADVLQKPLYEKSIDSGSPYFCEPLDLIVCKIDTDGDLVHYHFDSRRFKISK